MANWDESEHPRHPRGSERGGRFANQTGWAMRISDQIGDLRGEDRWKPGEWRLLTDLEWFDDTRELLRPTVAKYFSGVQLEAQLDKMVEGAPSPVATYANGPHRIKVLTRDDWPIPEILQEVDRLIDYMPPPKLLNLNLIKPSDLSDPDSDGESLMGDGLIRLSSKVLREVGYVDDFMSQAQQVPYWRYALVHEWGHAVDEQGRRASGTTVANSTDDQFRVVQMERTGRGRLWSGDDGFGGRLDLSTYGRTNPDEGVAEAFAEWYLSGGKTTNEAARDYADYYEWPVP